ncbi:MAG: hypothetical protein ACHQ9S_23495 [Candidatus Binatia bacterium]
MAMAVINGRRVILPDAVSDADIRRVGNIDPKRNLMRRTREGNFLVPRGGQVPVDDGDVFLDAPARVKG